jgi:hypothetical protein
MLRVSQPKSASRNRQSNRDVRCDTGMLKKTGIVGAIWRQTGTVGTLVLSLLAGEAVWNPVFAAEYDILNQSKTTIYHLYVAPQGTSRWSEDALGEDEEDALEPGDSVTLRDLDTGHYQFKIVFENERTCVIPNVFLEEGKALELNDSFLEKCH